MTGRQLRSGTKGAVFLLEMRLIPALPTWARAVIKDCMFSAFRFSPQLIVLYRIDCAVLGKLIEKYRLNPTLTSLHGAFADFQAARLESTVVVTNASRLRGEHRAGLVKGDDETIRTLYGPQSEFTKLMQSLLVTEF